MTESAALLARLKALDAQAGLSRRAAESCRQLIARLETPARVALFGPPNLGRTALVNALTGAEVLRPGAQAAPALIRFGEAACLRRRDETGRYETGTLALPVSFDETTLYAEIELPLDPLRAMTVLNVVAPPSAEEMAAALTWAAPRCDIAVWCTRDWTLEEQAIWRRGPDSLKNHAIMVTIGGAGREPDPAAACPLAQAVCHVGPLEADGALSEAAAGMLRQRLAGMIDEAWEEERDAAVFLIEKHGAHQPAFSRPEAAPPRTAAPAVLAEPAPAPSVPVSCTPVATAEAREMLSRAFLDLRSAAQALLRDCPDTAMDGATAQRFLDRMHAAIATVLERFEDAEMASDAWPGLHDTLCEAHELMQLLKVEGQPAQADEAAILLGQVREDIELALAA